MIEPEDKISVGFQSIAQPIIGVTANMMIRIVDCARVITINVSPEHVY